MSKPGLRVYAGADELPKVLRGLGIAIEVPGPNKIIINGCDKQQVGQFAAEVREKRPPEPYKAKGIKYTVFDRGGYVYHGRVKALAEGAREGGLQF